MMQLEDGWAAASGAVFSGAAPSEDALAALGAAKTLWEESILSTIRERLADVHFAKLSVDADESDAVDDESVNLHHAISELRSEIVPVVTATTAYDDSNHGRPNLRQRVLAVIRSEYLHGSLEKCRQRCMQLLRAALNDFNELFDLRQENDEGDSFILDDGSLPPTSTHPVAGTLISRLHQFEEMSNHLAEIGLLQLLCESASFRDLVNEVIRSKVTQTCEGDFYEEFLLVLEGWLETVVGGWLKFMRSSEGTFEYNVILAELRSRVRSELCSLRIRELFDIIVDFPDSLPAIDDLRNCLADATDLRAHLLTSLKGAFQKRLLHPGANTADILAQYILAIKALRKLDPSGVILEVVCRPVRAYLQLRDDTIRSIVRSLVDDSNSELSNELVEGKPIDIPDSDMSSDEEESHEWLPDPVDADPASSRSQRTGDITSVLINIYGSKELFVKEYRLLLSERLLALTDYDIDKEARYLELLKVRFGEEHMTHCDVMLKDIADSKRISTRIYEDLKDTSNEAALDCVGDLRIIILSRLFWPTLKGEDTLQLPEGVQGAFDVFTKKFEQLKAARTLDFKPHLGLVSVSLTLDSGTVAEFNVPPLVATIMFHFESKPEWTLEELSVIMKVPSATIQKRMSFWIRTGLIRVTAPGQYVLDEEGYQDHSTKPNDAADIGNDDDDGDEADEEVELHWQFIQGMLTNHPSMSLGRIHSMLSMFIEGGIALTEQGLQRFLNSQVDAGLLSYAQGEYSLPS